MIAMSKRSKTKWDDTRLAAIQSEMATPTKSVEPCNRHWEIGQRVIYRGIKARVVVQHGNWVRIEESEKGASYQVYADLLHNPNEKPNSVPLKPTEKAVAQQDANEILAGCHFREDFKKALKPWPELVAYVDELDFSGVGAGMLKMRIGNKLRAALRKTK